MLKKISRIAPLLIAASCSMSPVAAELDPNKVILENAGVKITVADFDAAMTRFPEDLRLEARANPETIMKMIDALFVNRMLAQQAAEAKIPEDPMVRMRLKQVEESFLALKYLEKVEKDYKAPGLDARAQELYKADPKAYTIPEMVELSDIVVSLNGRTPELAAARASEAREKLVAGAPLAAIAKQYSDDPQAYRHQGNLGWVRAADLDIPVAQAAFAQKPGEWSNPVVTRNGVHVMRVTGKREAKLQTFAEVKASIIDAEVTKLRKRATEEAIARIRNDRGNKIYPEVVESLKSDIDPSMIDKAHRDAIDKIQSQR